MHSLILAHRSRSHHAGGVMILLMKMKMQCNQKKFCLICICTRVRTRTLTHAHQSFNSILFNAQRCNILHTHWTDFFMFSSFFPFAIGPSSLKTNKPSLSARNFGKMFTVYNYRGMIADECSLSDHVYSHIRPKWMRKTKRKKLRNGGKLNCIKAMAKQS